MFWGAQAAVLGGIAAQEVLKACSGKFMPLKQWFMFDCTVRARAPVCSQLAQTGMFASSVHAWCSLAFHAGIGRHVCVSVHWQLMCACEALTCGDGAQEILPEEPLPASEFELKGTRYDGQIAVLGKTLHEKLTNLKYFLVSMAGASLHVDVLLFVHCACKAVCVYV